MNASIAIYGIVTLVVVSCAPAAPGPQSAPGAEPAAPAAPRGEKIVVIGQLSPIKAYTPWDFTSTAGGGAALTEIHSVSLISEDVEGRLEPRLAVSMPSLEDGSITMLSDGRMRTVWRLRTDVKWHDGTPFSAEDLAFTWEAASHPEVIGFVGSSSMRQAESLEAIDRSTIAITWRTTYFNALHIGIRDFWPWPRHLLAEAFQGNKEAFRNHSYFTTEFVNLGPFRLVDVTLGEEQVFEGFDAYFLGQPRLNRVIIRTITNPNALLANLKAGAIDIAAEKTLPTDLAVELRDEWQATGEGTVLPRQDNWLQAWPQFDAEVAHPIEISHDIRIRRGLFHAIDREAIREFALPGVPNTSGDTFVKAKDPRSGMVGQPFGRYRYDPARASEELAVGGWHRAADGRLLRQDGRQVQIQLFGFATRWAKEMALIADYWRQLGIDAVEYMPSPALSRDREHRTSFSGVSLGARSSGEDIFQVYDSRNHATRENRWTGSNLSHYANPALDRLIDRLYSTLDESARGMILKEMGELLASDLPVMPIYFVTTFAVVRKGVSALRDDHAGMRSVGVLARRAHLWDRD